MVKSGIDEELDEMKRTYEGLDSLLVGLACERIREEMLV